MRVAVGQILLFSTIYNLGTSIMSYDQIEDIQRFQEIFIVPVFHFFFETGTLLDNKQLYNDYTKQ